MHTGACPDSISPARHIKPYTLNHAAAHLHGDACLLVVQHVSSPQLAPAPTAAGCDGLHGVQCKSAWIVAST